MSRAVPARIHAALTAEPDECTVCADTGEVAVVAIATASGLQVRLDLSNKYQATTPCPACLGLDGERASERANT